MVQTANGYGFTKTYKDQSNRIPKAASVSTAAGILLASIADALGIRLSEETDLKSGS